MRLTSTSRLSRFFAETRGTGQDLLRIKALEREIPRAQRRRGIGREERVAGPPSEENDTSLFEMTDGATADVWLGDVVDFDGGHDAGGHSASLERILQGEGVHHGTEHADVVGGMDDR